MKHLIRKINSSYSNSPKALLVEEVPIRETTANLTESHFICLKAAFNYTTEKVFEKFIEDEELTQHCMAISEPSLKEGWENEDDDKWSRFLKD